MQAVNNCNVTNRLTGVLTSDFCGENVRSSYFNAFDQMKAYSDNGEKYGYYGYDDAGQRMYKMQLS